MRGVLLAILLVSVFSISARADVFDDYDSAYQNAMNQIVNQANTDAKSQQQALQAENAAALALANQQQQEEQQLDQAQAQITTLQKNQTALQTRVSNPLLGQPHKLLGFLWKVQSKNQKENEADQRQLNQVTQQLAVQNNNVSTMTADIKSRSAEIAAEQQKLQAVQQAASAAVTRAANLPADQQLQVQQATIQANNLFNQQRMNGFQAKFMLSDLNQLQTQGKLTQVQVQALKSASDGQLNNTLMGQYVNTQIQKAVASTCSPAFQSACTSNVAGGAASYINQQLSAPSASGAQVSTDAVKVQSVAPGAGDSSAPAAGSSAGVTH